MNDIHMKDIDPKQWVSAKDASEILGVVPATVTQMLRAAGIEAIYPVDAPGRRGYYWRAAVRKLARERAQARQMPLGCISKAEAAALLGVSENKVYELAKLYELPIQLVQQGKGLGKNAYRRKHVELLRRAMDQSAASPEGPHDAMTPRFLRALALRCRQAGLSVMEFSALCMIEESGAWVPMPQLVEWLGVSRAAASQTVSGWVLPLDAVEKTRSPSDERTVWVRITEAGKARLARIRGEL